MLKFLIDEDMPRSTAKAIRDKGYEAIDVRDCGLRGSSDDEIFRFAQEGKAIILTGDFGFGNVLKYPVGSYQGVVIVHFPNEISVLELNHQIIKAFNNLSEKDFAKNLIIIEPHKIRIRRV